MSDNGTSSRPRTFRKKDPTKLALIHAVKTTPELWDTGLDEYRRKNVNKDDFWARIAEDLGLELADVKKEWGKLRDEFVKQFKRQDYEEPTWLYYYDMEFLERIQKQKYEKMLEKTSKALGIAEDLDVTSRSLGIDERKHEEIAVKPTYRVGLEQGSSAHEFLEKKPRLIFAQETDFAKPLPETEASIYGKLVTMKLEGFSPQQRALARRHIDNVLYEIEFGSNSQQQQQVSAQQPGAIHYASGNTPPPQFNIGNSSNAAAVAFKYIGIGGGGGGTSSADSSLSFT